MKLELLDLTRTKKKKEQQFVVEKLGKHEDVIVVFFVCSKVLRTCNLLMHSRCWKVMIFLDKNHVLYYYPLGGFFRDASSPWCGFSWIHSRV